MASELSCAEYDVSYRLIHDYEFFARHIQRIAPKDLEEQDEKTKQLVRAITGDDPLRGMIPFIFHPGQQRLHRAVQDQLKLTSRVRKALVKPRQVGWSTYIQGRGHHKATKTDGLKVFIVSHTKDSTEKFLRRVKTFCQCAPQLITPGSDIDNRKEIVFKNGATYALATAGEPDSIRSDNCQFLHGSEVAMWKFLLENMGAIIPTLSDAPGSEGFLESSSKGKNTPWHIFIQECLAGQTEWEVFFDPWYLHPKYRMPAPADWQPDSEAIEAGILYGLDRDQLYWRAMKIKSLRALWLFKQEYPATLEESFQSSADTLYNPDVIYRARKSLIMPDPHAPLIMGVDPARTGDRTVIAFRQGRVFRKILTWPKMDDMKLVGIIANFLDRGFEGTPVAKCFIDYAIGEGPASRLRELNFQRQVTTIHFGEAASEDRYLNKRIEMAMALRDWFGDTGDQVSIPDSDDVSSDLLAIPDFLETSGSEKIKLAPKDVIKKEFGKSPDIFDAMVLTFAYPVAAEPIAALQEFSRQNFSHLGARDLANVTRDFSV